MAELLIVRHGQASFGAQDYDRLSDIGHRQSALLGETLRERGWAPDRVVTGTLRRQTETLRAMGFGEPSEAHAGLNEYNFTDLLAARFKHGLPKDDTTDRRHHFRILRDTVFEWQNDKLTGVAETWKDFKTRVEAGRQFATRPGAKRVLVISSGGVIGQMVAAALGAPDAQMMHLNLQIKNAAMTRFIFTQGAFSLHEFNMTPHLDHPDLADIQTFS